MAASERENGLVFSGEAFILILGNNAKASNSSRALDIVPELLRTLVLARL